MADSPKISLLDLQTIDLSQYARRNHEQRQGATRGTDSSYRKQLSESLAKKQTKSAPESNRDVEARSAGLKPDDSRSDTNRTESESASEVREDRNSVEPEKRESERQDPKTTPDESRIENTRTEKPGTDPEQETPDQSESYEAAEETVNPQAVNIQPVQEKEQKYSLFSTSFADQNEASSEQEVTTVEGDIQPPAHFQLSGEQSPVNLQTDVTEVGLNDRIPVPEGLAEQLNKQVIETSQTETGQVASGEEINQLLQNLATSQTEDGETEDIAPAGETNETIELDQLSQLKLTDELKQAIEEYQANQSAAGEGTAESEEVDIQALIEQLYQKSRQENSTESDGEEAPQGEVPLDQESLQQISDTVIEQLQPEAETEKSDIREIVSVTNAEQAKQAGEPDPIEEGPSQHMLNPGIKASAEIPDQPQVEATKPATVTHEKGATDADQPLVQPAGTTAAPGTTGAQSTTAAGPTVDVKQVEQLVERVADAVRQSQSTGQQLRIRLSPPELGTLQIEVSLKNGEYAAKLEVQNSSAQKVINDNIAQLKEALAKTGVSLDRIDVHINTDSTEDQRSSFSDAQTQSGNDFESNQFSENSGDSEDWQQEPGYSEEAVKQEDSNEQDRPQVTRSQGVARENVEEIDVQI